MELEQLLSEKKKYEIFKTIWDVDNFADSIHVMSQLCKSFENIKYLPTMYKAHFFKIYNQDTLIIREENAEISYDLYPSLLEKIKKLSTELNLNTSLELSYLCNYLIYNGYLSINKEFNFQRNNRMALRGMYYLDIINGIGVCSALADFLKNFLIYCGYNSSTLATNMPNNAVRFYESDEYKSTIDLSTIPSNKKKFSEFLCENIFKISNHLFTLVEDKDKLYIYDPTSAIILGIKDIHTSEIITGLGTCEIFPYNSFFSNYGNDELKAINKLFMTDDFSSPYSNNDFCSLIDDMDEIFDDTLFDYFYDDSHSIIESISKASSKIKLRRMNQIDTKRIFQIK